MNCTRNMMILTRSKHVALAPPAVDRDKPSHNSKVDLKTVHRFEQEAYYRHGRDLPHFDRRIHLWISGNSDEQALKKIETDEPQAPLAQLSHSLDRVLFKCVIAPNCVVHLLILKVLVQARIGLKIPVLTFITLINGLRIYRTFIILITSA